VDTANKVITVVADHFTDFAVPVDPGVNKVPYFYHAVHE